jgi:lysophospholipid acyltransferase (LPLAT)-like uncharacterized protein
MSEPKHDPRSVDADDQAHSRSSIDPSLRSGLKIKILSFIGMCYLHLMNKSLRARHVNAHHMTGTPQYIVAFWHLHILPMLYSRFRRPIAVMSSRSKDGDIMVGAYRYFGVDTVRGSSSKNASGALREFIRLARAGSNIVFTPDGPKGPPRQAKDGIIFTAKVTGLPIVPVAFAAKKKSNSRRGTGWSYRGSSPVPSISTASRFTSLVTVMSRSGGATWNGR